MISVASWETHPYQLVSWWDMEQFSARGFFWSGLMMQAIETDCLSESLVMDPETPIFNLAAPVNERTRVRSLRALKTIEGQCRQVGMAITADTAKEIHDDLTKEIRLVNFQWLIDQVKGLRKLFEKESKGRVFFYVPSEKSRYFPRNDQPFPFGEAIDDAFPSAQFDIHEAAVCLGCSRSTACVFHLMRVMEIALGVLGKKFGVSLAHTNWAPAIDQIESKIREMHKDPAWRAIPDSRDSRSFTRKLQRISAF